MDKQIVEGVVYTRMLRVLACMYSFGVKVVGVTFLLLVVTSQLFAQNGLEVSGTVTEVNGEPLAGVNVSVPGTDMGTSTNADGQYVLTIDDPGTILVFSYIGYQVQEVEVAGRTTIDIVLTLDTTQLDDLVVVGYGTQRRSEITGSVGVVSSRDLEQPAFNTLQSLRGKVAGVNIFTNSGSPTGSNRVVIRGVGTINASSSPLYVVDGVVIENIDYINPNDIQSIEVLKDASATAIYGAR